MPEELKNPIQPLYIDETGRVRFKSNKIVEDMLENSSKNGFGLNELPGREYSTTDYEQFMQLIGYSLDGFGELSQVTDETYNMAAENAPEQS